MFQLIDATLSADLVTTGTKAFTYPTGYDAGDFVGGVEHKLVAQQAEYSAPNDFTVAIGATAATITWKHATTIPDGEVVTLQLDQAGTKAFSSEGQAIDSAVEVKIMQIDLGSPAAIDVNGVCESQSGAAGAMTLDGALVTDGVAIFDYPRNVIIDSGGADTAVLTVTGTDVYGNAVVENITLNGTTAVAGKKAFKTITGIVTSATTSNGVFVGNGDVLGLPVFLPNAANILKELEDGAAPSAGTTVAGVVVAATATSGDVRGTYDPDSACDGTVGFSLIVAVPSADYIGGGQFTG